MRMNKGQWANANITSFCKKNVGFFGKEKQLNDFLIFPAPRCNRVTRPRALSHIQSIWFVTLQNVRLFLREKGPNNDRKEPIKNSCFQNDSFFKTLVFPYIQVCNIPSPNHHQIGVLVRASGAQLERIGHTNKQTFHHNNIYNWAGESASAWQRRWELSKGPESRSRTVYAQLGNNSEPERARVCQRAAMRASESQSESHREQ